MFASLAPASAPIRSQGQCDGSVRWLALREVPPAALSVGVMRPQTAASQHLRRRGLQR